MTPEIAILLLACITAPIVCVIAAKLIIRREHKREAERTAMRMLGVTDDPSVRAARNVN